MAALPFILLRLPLRARVSQPLYVQGRARRAGMQWPGVEGRDAAKARRAAANLTEPHHRYNIRSGVRMQPLLTPPSTSRPSRPPPPSPTASFIPPIHLETCLASYCGRMERVPGIRR